jgi:hypothetical protein
MKSMNLNEIRKAIESWTPTEGDEDLQITASLMAEADLNEMSLDDFINRSYSEISWEFMNVCVDSNLENIHDILNICDAEQALDELGLGENQDRIDMSKVVVALHKNYFRGISILCYYIELFEHIKNYNNERKG